jgi:hypothetical protein
VGSAHRREKRGRRGARLGRGGRVGPRKGRKREWAGGKKSWAAGGGVGPRPFLAIRPRACGSPFLFFFLISFLFSFPEHFFQIAFCAKTNKKNRTTHQKYYAPA